MFPKTSKTRVITDFCRSLNLAKISLLSGRNKWDIKNTSSMNFPSIIWLFYVPSTLTIAITPDCWFTFLWELYIYKIQCFEENETANKTAFFSHVGSVVSLQKQLKTNQSSLFWTPSMLCGSWMHSAHRPSLRNTRDITLWNFLFFSPSTITKSTHTQRSRWDLSWGIQTQRNRFHSQHRFRSAWGDPRYLLYPVSFQRHIRFIPQEMQWLNNEMSCDSKDCVWEALKFTEHKPGEKSEQRTCGCIVSS